MNIFDELERAEAMALNPNGMRAYPLGLVCACTWVPVPCQERAQGKLTQVFATCMNPKCVNHGKRFVLPLLPLTELPR